jgi:Glycosyl transferase family 2/Glycosyl transferases group 1
LEAMAAARPVVAFTVDGLRAALGDTGVMLKPGDVPGMARALVGFLTDPPAATAAGRAARERLVAVGDLRTSVKAWDDLLTDLVSRRPRPAEPLRVVPVSGVVRPLVGGALRTTDVATVAGAGRADAVRAATLSALGVPVWWRGDVGAAPPVLGAPVITGPADTERLAQTARRPGAGTPDGPPVSVVVTVLNEGTELGRLVEDLLPQIADDDEIVIVDGGSTDGSVAALAQHPRLRVDVVPGASISAGRNHGIRIARNAVIICTDAGCVPEPGFVDGFRRAFAVAEPPALVSGVYTVLAGSSMQRAQALACYPQPAEVRRPSLFVRVYTRLFGTGFDPRFAVGRCMAFTRDHWARADGFPEHLATGEDVSFGLAVARNGACVASTDAVVGWTQRDGLAATWRMYRGYGRASTDGGDPALLVRDGIRALAYVIVPALVIRPRGRRLVAAGAAAYLSLPVLRAVRARAPMATVALLPIALVVKDLGKLAGALQGLDRRRTR